MDEPGWKEDPTRRHELRYWDGKSWTSHVSDQGAQSTDQYQQAVPSPSSSPPGNKSFMDWARETPWWAWVIGAVVAIAVVSNATHSGHKLKPAPAGAKSGTWDGECEIGFLNKCTDEGARHKLEAKAVWCQWRGSDVLVHVELRSHFNAALALSVIPRYVIKDGGQHGTEFDSEKQQKIPAQGTAIFDINAGTPKGVPPGTTISECKPKLYDVKIA